MLVTSSLAADLKEIFDYMDGRETSNDWLAYKLAEVIDKQIKTALVTVQGIQTGPSVATGSLS